MSEALTRDDWVARVLGVRLPASSGSPPLRPVRFAPAPPLRPSPRAPDLVPRPLSGQPIRPAHPAGAPATYAGAAGRTLQITHGADGRVALAAPPPPVRTLTFSGAAARARRCPARCARSKTAAC